MTRTKKLSQHAKDVLKRAKATIRKSIKQKTPYRFDMNTWCDIGDTQDGDRGIKLPHGFCGTAGCLAGTIALNEGYVPSYVDLDERCASDFTFKRPHGRKEYDVPEAAARELGITKEVAEAMFIPFDTPNRAWFGLDWHKAEDAITAIDRFIRMDGDVLYTEDADKQEYWLEAAKRIDG